MSTPVYLSIGSNKGKREDFINKSLLFIHTEIGTINCISSLYESSSWGYKDDPYLNCVIRISSSLSAFEVLKEIQEIELMLGRNRKTHTYKSSPKYESRVIDIDILFYGDEIIQTRELTVPHIHMQKRKFVLIPFSEIDPNFCHPIFQTEINKLLKHCTDKSIVQYYSSIQKIQ